PAADEIVRSITSFALYGFPESHAASFALLVYASAYLKAHHPAVFVTTLLNNQPMGFYSPATLVQDATRHGVEVLPITVTNSDWDCRVVSQAPPVVRLGLRYVSGLRSEAGHAVAAERRRAPFQSLDDLRRRTGLNRSEARLLAELGALDVNQGRESQRRDALWQVERSWRAPGSLYEELPADDDPVSPLPPMSVGESMLADFRNAGLTLGPHPMALRRSELRQRGIRTAEQIRTLPHGRRVQVAGMVLARQRPGTAKGIVFMSLEDETGIVNIIIPSRTFETQRQVCVSESVLWIEGTLQNRDGVVHVKASRILPLAGAQRMPSVASYDFR
ncbi:MAG: OB-fold nucleic acid binding domain-containing protein, partial [Terriglobales bacterium]